MGQQGMVTEASNFVEACRIAEEKDCMSIKRLQEFITESTGVSNPSEEDALELQENIEIAVFSDTAIAAKDSNHEEEGKSKLNEQMDLVQRSTGIDLSVPGKEIEYVQLSHDAGAFRVASVAKACFETDVDSCEVDKAADEAEGINLDKTDSSKNEGDFKLKTKRAQRRHKGASVVIE